MLHPSERIFNLVNDIGAYPQFVTHCVGSEIHEATEQQVRATLQLKKTGVKTAFTTANTLYPSNKIVMALVDGPFRSLQGEWRFSALRDDACKVELDLEFEMDNGALAKLVGGLFESVGNNLVDAFCQRANDLYGRNSSYLKTLR